MKSDLLFRESATSDPFGDATEVLDIELINQLRTGPPVGQDELQAAIALAELLAMDFESYGTHGSTRVRDDNDLALCVRALNATTQRIGIEFDLPWRDYASFRTYWNANDGHGSWQARREMVEQHFGPLRDELSRREDQADSSQLAEASSPHASTGWPDVDVEIRELRRRFRSATTPQDYRAVGTDCVGVLEALSRTVYDPSIHVREGERPLDLGKSKLRIERFIEDGLPGKENEHIRGLARKAIELAHDVKHSPSATRRDSGIAADAAILLANILRRIDLG